MKSFKNQNILWYQSNFSSNEHPSYLIIFFLSSSTQMADTNATTETWHFNSTHFPFKLNHSNYTTWKSSVTSLLISHSLLGFVDGSITAPVLPAIGASATQQTAFAKWQAQDHTVKHALMSSITEAIVPFIASAKTSQEIWQSLQIIFS